MSAEIISLRTAVIEPVRRACWPCLFVWCAPPVLVVAAFAWVLL